jgi:hypothetical protein
MKNSKHITLLEIFILVGLLGYIVLRWNITSVSVGDFFCLELLAMMFWYRYDNFKN